MDIVPTLAEVLAAPSLDLRVVVPGDGPVRWVATSELADPTPFLEGGEILLTTGLTTADWDAEWEPYALRLVDAGAVALGVGVGLTHAVVPPALRSAAAAAGLPVFAVPRPVPFVAVTREVARLVEREEQRALRTAAELQRRLTRAAVALDGPAAILRTLGAIVGGSARICGPDGAGLDPDVVGRLRAAGLRGSHSASGPEGSTLVQPLGLTGPPRGYLLVTGPRPWDAAHHGAVATAVTLLSLDAERRADALAATREIRSGAWALLLAGAVDAALQVLRLRSAATAPVSGEGRFHVVRVRGEGALDVAESWAAERPAAGNGTAASRAISSQAAESRAAGSRATGNQAAGSGAAGSRAAVGPRVLLVAPAGVDAVVVLRAAGTAEGRVDGSSGRAIPPPEVTGLVRPGIRVGVGAPEPLARMAGSDATALAALARAGPDRPVVRWDDVVDHGLVALIDGPAGEAFARRVLGPLAEPGHEDLHATLEQFHAHHGQLTLVAAALGVHRNTVRRRLRRVEELTGRSLGDPRARAELWVARQVVIDASARSRPHPAGDAPSC